MKKAIIEAQRAGARAKSAAGYLDTAEFYSGQYQGPDGRRSDLRRAMECLQDARGCVQEALKALDAALAADGREP